MAKIIDPYGSELVEDYEKIIKDFGLEPFNVDLFPKPNRLMRRGVVFAGRDLEIISKSIKDKKKFYVLSGLMPSGDKLHFGNKMVVENIRYFQEQGAQAYILVADLEAAAARVCDRSLAWRAASASMIRQAGAVIGGITANSATEAKVRTSIPNAFTSRFSERRTESSLSTIYTIFPDTFIISIHITR